jgi:hypothetical protein
MAAIDDETMRWLARTLEWNCTLARLRNRRADAVVDVRADVRGEPRPEPVSLREPARAPSGAPGIRVPLPEHQVA